MGGNYEINSKVADKFIFKKKGKHIDKTAFKIKENAKDKNKTLADHKRERAYERS